MTALGDSTRRLSAGSATFRAGIVAIFATRARGDPGEEEASDFPAEKVGGNIADGVALCSGRVGERDKWKPVAVGSSFVVA